MPMWLAWTGWTKGHVSVIYSSMTPWFYGENFSRISKSRITRAFAKLMNKGVITETAKAENGPVT